MKLGAEPRKLALLGVLVLVALYAIFDNSGGDIPEGARANVSRPKEPAPMAGLTQPRTPPPAAARKAPARRDLRVSQEFEPRIGPRRPEDRPDPTTLDPSLRLDLIAKLKQVTLSGGDRSLFDFSQPPAPPVPAPKILPTAQIKPSAASPPVEATRPAEASKPPPPPIPLKYYGFIAGGPMRRGFFLNGEEIFVAGEGDTVQRRYKIVRVGLNSVVVEDTDHKHQQTLPLEQVPQG